MIKEARIGLGAYGVIYSAHSPTSDPSNENRNQAKNNKLAVKRNLKDSKVSFVDSIRELDILVKLSGHPNIVLLKYVTEHNPFGGAIMSPIATRGLTDDRLFFVFEKATCDLLHIIQNYKLDRKSYDKIFLDSLLGLEYMHKMGIIHRDIKPGNILWYTRENTAKLCDFGLSGPYTVTSTQPSNAVTCWYRPPEVIIGKNYNPKVDVYALALSMMELYSGTAILLGTQDTPKYLLESIFRTTLDDQAEIDVLSEETGVVCRFRTLIHGISDGSLLDLLKQMSKLDPEKRFTATQALDHPFFNDYRGLIEKSREIPIRKLHDYRLKLIPAIERTWMFNTMYEVFNHRTALPWYTHQVIFQAIDIFDRLLDRLPKIQEIESRYTGHYLSKVDTHLYTLVCLYIAVKYFRILSTSVAFSDIATSEYTNFKSLIKAEEYERYLINDVLQFRIYRATVYDCADRELSELEVRNLLIKLADVEACQNARPEDLLPNRN